MRRRDGLSPSGCHGESHLTWRVGSERRAGTVGEPRQSDDRARPPGHVAPASGALALESPRPSWARSLAGAIAPVAGPSRRANLCPGVTGASYARPRASTAIESPQQDSELALSRIVAESRTQRQAAASTKRPRHLSLTAVVSGQPLEPQRRACFVDAGRNLLAIRHDHAPAPPSLIQTPCCLARPRMPDPGAQPTGSSGPRRRYNRSSATCRRCPWTRCSATRRRTALLRRHRRAHDRARRVTPSGNSGRRLPVSHPGAEVPFGPVVCVTAAKSGPCGGTTPPGSARTISDDRPVTWARADHFASRPPPGEGRAADRRDHVCVSISVAFTQTFVLPNVACSAARSSPRRRCQRSTHRQIAPWAMP